MNTLIDKMYEEDAEDKRWTQSKQLFEKWLSEKELPLGEKVSEYHTDAHYTLYKCSFDTPGFVNLHRNIQHMLLFFIEGASFIEEDHRWEAYLLYKNDEELIGYCTCYPFFFYPDKVRMRISQILILPPYQGKGHGGRLYRFLYERFLHDSNVADITVEDPSEGFSDLRTICDLRRLLEEKELEEFTVKLLKNEAGFDQDFEELRQRFKFSKQHFTILLEMYFLNRLGTRKNTKAFKAYRVWIKKRIYKKNEDVLKEMKDARLVKEKLDLTFQTLTEDYERVLSKLG